MGKNSTKPTSKANSSPEGKAMSPMKTQLLDDQQTPSSSSSKRKNLRKPSTDDTPSSSEPLSKKNRLDSTETAEEDNTRRRRTLKHGEVALPVCSFCKEDQKADDEPLKECSECKAKYHIRKCLRYKEEFATNILKLNKWFCPRCVECDSCKGYIGDPSNIECTFCCRAWHGSCAPKGYSPSGEFDSDWYCIACCRVKGIKIWHTTSISHRSHPSAPVKERKTKRGGAARKDELEFEGDIDELKDLLAKRDLTFEILNYEAGFSSKKPLPYTPTSSGKKNKKKQQKSPVREEFDYSNAERSPDFPKVVRADLELFKATKSEAYQQTPIFNPHPEGQFLHFGTGKACKAIYSSAYEEPLHSSAHLYACKFCLHTTNLKEDLIVHWDICNAKHPPGTEIYRNDGLAFFEVDGAVQKKYCQDLCLISKLFIASKTLYDEVETFKFYVLCEITTEGYVIVGYFSKEKNPSKNNNLSCLLVLPMVQKMGYGRLLIDMSYELSRLEMRIGHPEHPLSDLGILAYRGYWRSSLLCYIREHRNYDRLNIKDMCLATRIAPVDIVNQLMLDNMIVLKGGVYSIKIGKRALKFPLSQCRRRFVDPSQLFWKPKPSAERLDPTKINNYV